MMNLYFFSQLFDDRFNFFFNYLHHQTRKKFNSNAELLLHASLILGSRLISSRVKQCSAQVFKRAGCQFSKRAFSVRCSTIKKALTTVISTFYQHFDSYIVMVTCLTAACSFALKQ